MTVEIKVGDCIDVMSTMPEQSVHCVVTSPPYWGLRDYNVDGQIGLEQTLDQHLDMMLEVFRAVRRVLRDDGTLWLNYGDCYATSPNGRAAHLIDGDDRGFVDKPFSTVGTGPIIFKENTDRRGQSNNLGNGDGSRCRISGRNGNKPISNSILDCSFREIINATKAKDRCLIPEVLILALRADGWYVRQVNIWAKPNPMPESIKDRPGNAWEPMILLSKSKKYFYDAEAVREARTDTSWQGQDTLSRCVDAKRGQDPKDSRNSFNRKDSKRGTAQIGQSTGTHRPDRSDGIIPDGKRHLRNVWNIATKPFKEAHFATFPPDLVEPCIKAGCPEGGIVFDPFGGAGTTGLVADRLGRDAILIELNPEYAAIAEARISGDASLFSEVKVEAAQ